MSHNERVSTTPLTHIWSPFILIFRGSMVTSCIIFSTMRLLCYFTFSVLCSLQSLSTGNAPPCNHKQYAWPLNKPNECCDKCPPGEFMKRRLQDKCGIECIPCIGDRFTDTYNVEISCSVCETCNKPNMEIKSPCNTTHNAVCQCKAGFRCNDQSCTSCEPMPATVKPTLPPSTKDKRELGLPPFRDENKKRPPQLPEAMTTTGLTPVGWGIHSTASRPGVPTTPKPSPEPIKDSVWFLVIVALLCAGIALVLMTKIKPFLLCIRLNYSYLLAEKHAEVPCAEVVSQPVQEVCGKCDQRIDGCMKD